MSPVRCTDAPVPCFPCFRDNVNLASFSPFSVGQSTGDIGACVARHRSHSKSTCQAELAGIKAKLAGMGAKMRLFGSDVGLAGALPRSRRWRFGVRYSWDRYFRVDLCDGVIGGRL